MARLRGKSKSMKEDPSSEAGCLAPDEDDSIEIVEVVGLDEEERAPAEGPASRAPASDALAGVPDSIPFTLEQLYEMLLRKQAEFENARKRMEREREESRRRIWIDLLQSLLPILDNFQRALAAPPPAPPDAFHQGVSMTFQQMMDVLAREGLEEIRTLGERFDPQIHEAVETRVVEGFEEGVVLAELRRGYLFQGQLLRPALVRVSGKGESRPVGKA